MIKFTAARLNDKYLYSMNLVVTFKKSYYFNRKPKILT